MEEKMEFVVFNGKPYLVRVAKFEHFSDWHPSDDYTCVGEPDVIVEGVFSDMIKACHSHGSLLHFRSDSKRHPSNVRSKFLSSTSNALKCMARRFSKSGNGQLSAVPFSLSSDDESGL